METDQVFDHEDRFRVDRRKLENLILGRFDPIKETAGDFFLRVIYIFLNLERFCRFFKLSIVSTPKIDLHLNEFSLALFCFDERSETSI